ncbi:hypothetical protein Nmel_003957, partial [Mimus melanotis]
CRSPLAPLGATPSHPLIRLAWPGTSDCEASGVRGDESQPDLLHNDQGKRRANPSSHWNKGRFVLGFNEKVGKAKGTEKLSVGYRCPLTSPTPWSFAFSHQKIRKSRNMQNTADTFVWTPNDQDQMNYSYSELLCWMVWNCVEKPNQGNGAVLVENGQKEGRADHQPLRTADHTRNEHFSESVLLGLCTNHLKIPCQKTALERPRSCSAQHGLCCSSPSTDVESLSLKSQTLHTGQRSLTTWKRLHRLSSSVRTELPKGRTAGQPSRSRACAHSMGTDRVQSSGARCRLPLLAFSRPQLKLPRFHRPGAGHQPASHPRLDPQGSAAAAGWGWDWACRPSPRPQHSAQAPAVTTLEQTWLRGAGGGFWPVPHAPPGCVDLVEINRHRALRFG